MFQEAVPRFDMLIIETLSNSISFAVINEFDKGAVTQTSRVLGHVYHVDFQRVL